MTGPLAESDDSFGRTLDRQIVQLAVVLAALAAILVFLPDLGPPASRELVSERGHARVVAVEPPTGNAGPMARIEVLGGAHAGETFEALVEGPSGQLQLPDYAVGDEVIVAFDEDPDLGLRATVIDRWRLPVIAWLLGGFALATVAVAGWRGSRAILSLAITLVIVVRILVPLLLAGWNPVWLAVGTGIVVTAVSLLLTQGRDRVALAAFVGAALGLLLTGIFAWLVTLAARFTPAQGSEEVVFLEQLSGGRLDLSGLLLAAVIFGALGVVMDVAVGQVATVAELHAVAPAMGRRELFRRSMNIGIAHLSANVNTLVFAYLGSALPLLVLIGIQGQDFGVQLSSEAIAVEVVRTVVGSLGVILSVPLTSAIASRWTEVSQRTGMPDA